MLDGNISNNIYDICHDLNDHDDDKSRRESQYRNTGCDHSFFSSPTGGDFTNSMLGLHFFAIFVFRYLVPTPLTLSRKSRGGATCSLWGVV